MMSQGRESTPHDWTVTARWVFPVDRPPLEQGTVTVSGTRVAVVAPRGSRTADLDLGNAAILPGLVNAHTHLDLTGLRGRCPPGENFASWLREVIGHRRGTTPEQAAQDVRRGLAECLDRGTTLVGDIASGGLSWDALTEAPSRAVVFYELLGPTRARAEPAWQGAEDWLRHHGGTARCRPGLSPHAPYSVCSWLYERAGEAARQRQLPLATHLAEARAELDLLEQRRGPLVPFLQDLGFQNLDELPHSLAEIRDQLQGLASLLLAHGNYLTRSAAASLGGTVVYCPRTHAAFGHPPHPFRDLIASGLPVALGTDSLASNPDLDVLAEARFLHRRHPDLSGDILLRMATAWGAEALGWQDETGDLAPGKSADFIVVPLPDREDPDPHALVLDSSLPVRAVLLQGRWRGLASALASAAGSSTAY